MKFRIHNKDRACWERLDKVFPAPVGVSSHSALAVDKKKVRPVTAEGGKVLRDAAPDWSGTGRKLAVSCPCLQCDAHASAAILNAGIVWVASYGEVEPDAVDAPTNAGGGVEVAGLDVSERIPNAKDMNSVVRGTDASVFS